MPLGIMHDHDDPLVVVVPLDGGAVFSNHAEALVEAQDWAWSIVFWCFCFALVLGAGSRPYLWPGQTTPGSWGRPRRPAGKSGTSQEVRSP